MVFSEGLINGTAFPPFPRIRVNQRKSVSKTLSSQFVVNPFSPQPSQPPSYAAKAPHEASRDTLHASRFTNRENKPNSKYPKITPTSYTARIYPNIPLRTTRKNKPNSNRGQADIPMHIGTQSPLTQAQPNHTPPIPPARLPAPRSTLHASRFTKYSLAETPFPNTIAQRRFYVHRSG